MAVLCCAALAFDVCVWSLLVCRQVGSGEKQETESRGPAGAAAGREVLRCNPRYRIKHTTAHTSSPAMQFIQIPEIDQSIETQ